MVPVLCLNYTKIDRFSESVSSAKEQSIFLVGICASKCRQCKIESNKIKGKKLNTSNHFECVYIYSKHHFLIRKSKTKIIAKNPRKANTRTMLHTIGFQAINKA